MRTNCRWQDLRIQVATTLGTTYAHNFHLLLLVKAGIVGMTAFALFVLAPIVIAMRSSSDIARSAAALAVGMAAVMLRRPHAD